MWIDGGNYYLNFWNEKTGNKSDYIFGDEDIDRIKETYSGQLSLYGEALEIIKNVKVKEKYLYLLNKGIAVLI